MKKLDVQDQVIPDNVVLHGLKQRNGKFIVRIFGEASRGQTPWNTDKENKMGLKVL